MMTVTALFATAGATNSGLYPAGGLCEQMTSIGQFPPVLGRRLGGRPPCRPPRHGRHRHDPRRRVRSVVDRLTRQCDRAGRLRPRHSGSSPRPPRERRPPPGAPGGPRQHGHRARDVRVHDPRRRTGHRGPPRGHPRWSASAWTSGGSVRDGHGRSTPRPRARRTRSIDRRDPTARAPTRSRSGSSSTGSRSSISHAHTGGDGEPEVLVHVHGFGISGTLPSSPPRSTSPARRPTSSPTSPAWVAAPVPAAERSTCPVWPGRCRRLPRRRGRRAGAVHRQLARLPGSSSRSRQQRRSPRTDRARRARLPGRWTEQPADRHRALRQMAVDGTTSQPCGSVPIAARDYLRFGVIQNLSLFKAMTRYPTLERLPNLDVPTW